ncbi:MAG TPA: GNAT family N-acetyltransferase, partial [Solirubrobacterales bacterium]|nr:GNAT family N-acetyltransferase [Solirubrobacterales bacterium]
GKRRVAMQLGARFGRSHWLFKIGYDAAFRPASPGQLLLAESVAAAARDGLETYELLGFCEEWTEAWTQEVRACAKVTVMPRNGRGALAYGAIHWRGAERHLRREAVKAKVGVLDVAKASYVAGPELDDALLEEARYAGAGYRTSVGFWNGPSDPPTRVAAEARASAEALPPGSEVSIKLAPIGGDGPVLDELVALCAERDLTLHLDALLPEGADATRDAALRLSRDHPGRVGCTLPGRWARSVEDARELSGTGVRVRVVKGEVAAGEGDEAELGAGFLAVVAALAGGSSLVEVASHDAPLVKRALGVLLESGTDCEHQVLHAMHAASAIRAAHRLGVATRVYVPYGTGRVPYTMATLQEHPTSTLTLARDLLRLPPRRPAIWVSHLFPFTDLFPF